MRDGDSAVQPGHHGRRCHRRLRDAQPHTTENLLDIHRTRDNDPERALMRVAALTRSTVRVADCPGRRPAARGVT
jgi:hypothetical protein